MTSKNRRSPAARPGEASGTVTKPPPPTTICGYRLVRLLGRTDAVTTWLATAVEPVTSTAVETVSPAPPVSVLVCERHAARERIPAAAFTLSSPYVQRILDVGSDTQGRLALVTERTQETLAELLAGRSELCLGEAVTILVPITAGIRAMHNAGLAHGALSTSTVGLTPEGRPLIILIGVDSSGRVPCPADPDLRRTDLGALRAILSQVFGRCVDTTAEGISSLLRWFDRSVVGDLGDSFFAQLDLRLFALAEPLPIDFTRNRGEADHPFGHSAAGPIREEQAHERVQQIASSAVLARWFGGTGLDTLAELADRYSLPRAIAARCAGLRGWASRALRGRAAVAVLATAVAMVVMWVGLTAFREVGTGGADASDSRVTEEPASAAVTPTDTESAAIEADDPLPALTALLAIRSRCLAAARPACIPLSDEPNSSAEETDVHALRSNGIVLLPEPVGVEQADMLQRTGNAALFRVTPAGDKENQPVLVLVMKTNAGWRVRDLAVPG